MIPNNISIASSKNTSSNLAELPTAILLAGGLSTRMGCCKQLRPLCGKPLIRYVLETLLEAGLTYLVITVNAETQQPIEAIIDQLRQKHAVSDSSLQGAAAEAGISQPVRTSNSFRAFSPFRCDIVLNPEPERGQGHSAALAVQAACARHQELLAANTACIGTPSGFLFCTADQPFLQANSVRELCTMFRYNSGNIVSAAFNGKHCSPVIFPVALADELSRLDGNIGGRTVMNAHPDLIVYSPLHSEMEAFDIDTPEDFKRAEKYVSGT